MWWMEKRWKDHGMYGTRFYNIYQHIKIRCNYKKDKYYHRYGWRWIINEWKNFLEFKNDMYNSYLEHIESHWEKQTTIDRIDNNGNYCKQNCRRATQVQQHNNRWNNIIVQWMSLHRYCLLNNLKYKTIHMRINTYKRSIEKAISQ